MARAVDLQVFTEEGEIDFDPVLASNKEAHIFCRSFEVGGAAAVDPRTGRPRDVRDYAGVKIQKRLDKASPKLFELFVRNTGIKAIFKIHKTDSSTSGTPDEVAMTVTIGAPDYRAWVSSYRVMIDDVEKRAADDPDEPYEEIVFSFTTIEIHKSGTDNTGKQHEIVVQDDVTAHH